MNRGHPRFDQLVAFLVAGNYPGVNVITEVFAMERRSGIRHDRAGSDKKLQHLAALELV